MEAVSRGREGTNTPQGPSAAVWWSPRLQRRGHRRRESCQPKCRTRALATRQVLVDSWSQLCSSFLMAEQDGWMLKAPDTITIDTILAWRQVQFIISTDKAPGTIVSMLARFNANVTGKKPGMTKMCNWLNARCYIGRFTEFKQVPLNLVLNGQKQWTMFNPIREFKGKYDAKRYWDSWTMNNVQGAC